MKEKNRETIAQSLYEKKELLDSKKEERARLYSYNKKKADQVQAEVLLLESELEILQKELLEADSNYTPPLPTQKSEKEKLYTIIAPLDRYMASGAAALEKRRFLLFFARHPKVVLAQMLHQGAMEAATLPKKMAPFKQGAYHNLCIEIEQFCQLLISHANQRWNSALYSGELLTLYKQWDKLVRCLRSNT